VAGFFVLIVWAGIGLLLPACHPLSPGRPLAGFDRSPSAPRAGKTVSPAAPLIALGDSITAAGPWSEAFPGRSVLNAGISGNTTVDLLGRLDVLPGLGGATVVLMAGINDLLQGEAPAPVADRILRIRRELLARGAARVVVVATLPVKRPAGAPAASPLCGTSTAGSVAPFPAQTFSISRTCWPMAPAYAVPWDWMACISGRRVTASGSRGWRPCCKLLSWLWPEGHAP
jgi:hypothetical protein